MRKKRTEITAFILSGGKSSRLGTDKAFLMLDGKPLIQRSLELLDAIFSEVVISSNNPEQYISYKKNVIEDLIPDHGPLSGIHSALKFSSTEKNFILSCDLPLVSVELINYLCELQVERRILLPRANERIQQLCGIYSKSCLPEVENLLMESSRPNSKLKGSVYELTELVDTEIVDVDSFNFYHSNLFLNINTPEDYNYLKEIFENH